MDPSFYQVLRLAIGRFSRTWLESASSLVWKDGHPYDQLVALIAKMETAPDATEYLMEFKTLITGIIRSWNAGKLSKPAEIDVELFKTTVQNIMDNIEPTAAVDEQLGPVYYTGRKLDKFMDERSGQSLAPIRITFPNNDPIVAVCSGSGVFTLFVTKSGNLYFVGFNPIGFSYSNVVSPIPRRVPVPEPIRQVSCRYGRFFAVTFTGKLYAWGSGIYGAAHSRKFGRRPKIETQIVMPENDPYAIHVECSETFAAILSTTGKVYMLGDYWGMEYPLDAKIETMQVFRFMNDPMVQINAQNTGVLSGCSASGACHILRPNYAEFSITPAFRVGKYVQSIALIPETRDEFSIYTMLALPDKLWRIEIMHINFFTPAANKQSKLLYVENGVDHISASYYGDAIVVITKDGKAWIINEFPNLVGVIEHRSTQISFADKIGDYVIGKYRNFILARVPRPFPFNINCQVCLFPAYNACANCQLPYCGTECQIQHWPRHQSECKIKD